MITAEGLGGGAAWNDGAVHVSNGAEAGVGDVSQSLLFCWLMVVGARRKGCALLWRVALLPKLHATLPP